MSNNDEVNDRIDESDNDRLLDDELTDGDQSSDNDGDVDGEVVAIRDGNITYHSNAIPYLDNTEESQEDFVNMRDIDSARTALWNATNPAYLNWMIHFREIPGGMWKADKMIELHTCETYDYKEDDFMVANFIDTICYE
ncbi:hypothetical protein HAX54_049615 [Datura stramonium]|uniref:Uncharacterized protein n=1 Tax=Datura stramonium TaxID=4076 RepID=A0ABS8SV57_DATST|nr:hypothetical protein [Datura stramonium]